MTTQADIKLVIDQLDQLDFGSIEDKHVVGNAINALETLGNKVAGQASEIASLRISYDAACMLVAQMHEAVMGKVIGPHHGVVEDVRNQVAKQAAVIEKLCSFLKYERSLYLEAGSDIRSEVIDYMYATKESEQILQEWLDDKLGEPVAYLYEYTYDLNEDKQGNWPIEMRIVKRLTITEPRYTESILLFKKPMLE